MSWWVIGTQVGKWQERRESREMRERRPLAIVPGVARRVCLEEEACVLQLEYGEHGVSKRGE